MTSPILVAVFTIVYLAVTVWLCRGLKLNARNLAMGGLACPPAHPSPAAHGSP